MLGESVKRKAEGIRNMLGESGCGKRREPETG
jgi:hypothetical protein